MVAEGRSEARRHRRRGTENTAVLSLCLSPEYLNHSTPRRACGARGRRGPTRHRPERAPRGRPGRAAREPASRATRPTGRGEKKGRGSCGCEATGGGWWPALSKSRLRRRHVGRGAQRISPRPGSGPTSPRLGGLAGTLAACRLSTGWWCLPPAPTPPGRPTSPAARLSSVTLPPPLVGRRDRISGCGLLLGFLPYRPICGRCQERFPNRLL